MNKKSNVGVNIVGSGLTDYSFSIKDVNCF